MKFIIGKKIGMTRVFDENGRHNAVTLIKALPCQVSLIRNIEQDGYIAAQVRGLSEKGKALKVAEFPISDEQAFKVGDEIKIDQFEVGETVTVEGTAKGKGFAGTIKRHSFAMGPVSHGSKNVRKPGSIGGGYPQRVVLGKKMAGRMGGDQVTISNLKVMGIDDNIILIKGAIPGPNKSLVKVYAKSVNNKKEEVSEE